MLLLLQLQHELAVNDEAQQREQAGVGDVALPLEDRQHTTRTDPASPPWRSGSRIHPLTSVT